MLTLFLIVSSLVFFINSGCILSSPQSSSTDAQFYPAPIGPDGDRGDIADTTILYPATDYAMGGIALRTVNKDGNVRVYGQNITNGSAVISNISYTIGSPILTGSIAVNIIYYGAWTSNNQKKTIESFINNFSSSSYWKVVQKYTSRTTADAKSSSIKAGTIKLGKTYTDGGYSQGQSMLPSSVQKIVYGLMGSNAIPNDPSNIYLVLFDQFSAYSSLCVTNCGGHSYFKAFSMSQYAYANFNFAFVGNPGFCKAWSTCGGYQPNQSKSPNKDPVVDAMISQIANVLIDTVTDPLLNAWKDSTGIDNGEAMSKCAWNYGPAKSIKPATNGGSYNVAFGGKQYMIQQVWSPTTQKCVLQ